MAQQSLQEQDLVPYSAAREVARGRALVLAPHPDDEVLGCAGAILRHRLAGDSVRTVVLTDGGHQDGVDREAYVRARRRESEAAARILDCDGPTFWELPDRSLCYGEELIERIAAAIDQSGAEIVYAPSPEENHPDHNALGLCALEAVRRSPREIRAALYEVSTPLRPNLLVDITDVEERKREAIACFTSQLEHQALGEQILALNRYRTYTLPPTVRAAEAFRVFTRTELRADPLGAFTQDGSGSEHRQRRGPFAAPLISVVVRTMGRDTLAEALRSIAAQTYPNVEVIVVDAKGGLGLGSSILSRRAGFPVRTAGGERRLSRSAAANAGLEAARGAHLLFLDDDDWIYPHHLAQLQETLSIHRYARAGYAGVELVEVRADGSRERVSAYDDAWDPARLLCENYIPIHAVLFHRSLVDEDGCRFDEALPLCEDWDFWIQLSRHTPFIHVPGMGGGYRMPGGSPLYDPGCSARRPAAEAIFAKWSARWTQQELSLLWGAARPELSPILRRRREDELAQLRARADEAGRALAARQAEAAARKAELSAKEAELDAVSKRAEELARRACEAEAEAARLRSALSEMSSSTAVRGARLLRSLSPTLQEAAARLGRTALDNLGDRPSLRR